MRATRRLALASAVGAGFCFVGFYVWGVDSVLAELLEIHA
jgi:hypothetical protein